MGYKGYGGERAGEKRTSSRSTAPPSGTVGIASICISDPACEAEGGRSPGQRASQPSHRRHRARGAGKASAESAESGGTELPPGGGQAWPRHLAPAVPPGVAPERRRVVEPGRRGLLARARGLRRRGLKAAGSRSHGRRRASGSSSAAEGSAFDVLGRSVGGVMGLRSPWLRPRRGLRLALVLRGAVLPRRWNLREGRRRSDARPAVSEEMAHSAGDWRARWRIAGLSGPTCTVRSPSAGS